MELLSGGEIKFAVSDDGFSTTDSVQSTATYDDGNLHKATFGRNGSNFELHIDDVLIGTTAVSNATGSLNNSGASLFIGTNASLSAPFTNGSVICGFKISGTWSSDDSQTFAYETERPIVVGGKPATLAGTSDTVTAIGEDTRDGVSLVGTSYGTSEFRHITRADEAATTVGTPTSVDGRDGERYVGGSGVDIDQPEINVKESL